MTEGRWWVALVTFERGSERSDVLPDRAQGACGWMAVLAPDAGTARRLLARDLEDLGLRVIEIAQERAVSGADDTAALDGHLASNVHALEPGKRTVWGTIHCYRGEGEA